MTKQWWLAEMDRYGNPKLCDGAHGNREGAEKALSLIRQLGLAGDRVFAVAEVRLSWPTGQHAPVDEAAIATLNAAGLRPNAKVSGSARSADSA